MAKYAPGDRVLVRDDLVLHHTYDMDGCDIRDSVVEPMMHWKGQIVTIRSVTCGKYTIAENGHWWTDGMFAGLERECALPDVSDLI